MEAAHCGGATPGEVQIGSKFQPREGMLYKCRKWVGESQNYGDRDCPVQTQADVEGNSGMDPVMWSAQQAWSICGEDSANLSGCLKTHSMKSYAQYVFI